MVIPPGYFKISSEEGCPKAGVKVKLDCWRNNSIKDDLSTLKDTGFVGASIGSGRKPNSTLVQVESSAWCMDRIATC